MRTITNTSTQTGGIQPLLPTALQGQPLLASWMLFCNNNASGALYVSAGSGTDDQAGAIPVGNLQTIEIGTGDVEFDLNQLYVYSSLPNLQWRIMCL
jgi:hypothetical protein